MILYSLCLDFYLEYAWTHQARLTAGLALGIMGTYRDIPPESGRSIIYLSNIMTSTYRRSRIVTAVILAM